MNYYDELLVNIDKLISSNELDEAKRLVENELSLPYIPRDIEEKLLEYSKQFKHSIKVNKTIEIDEIIEYLSGNDEHQLIAVDALSKKNLRDYIDICEEYLKNNRNMNAKALLIDSLIRQEINYEFSYVNDCSLIKFNPINLQTIEETNGFIEASKTISDYYFKDPSKIQLGLQLLFKEAMLSLPNEINGKIVSKKIIDYIENAFSAN